MKIRDALLALERYESGTEQHDDALEIVRDFVNRTCPHPVVTKHEDGLTPHQCESCGAKFRQCEE